MDQVARIYGQTISCATPEAINHLASKGTSLYGYAINQFNAQCRAAEAEESIVQTLNGDGQGGTGGGGQGVDLGPEKPFCWICLIIAAGIGYLLIEDAKK